MFPPDLAAVLFDAGGTLVHIDYASVAEVASEHGLALDPAVLRRAEGVARQRIDHTAGDRGARGTDASRLAGYFGNLLAAAGVDREVVGPIVERVAGRHREQNLWRVPMPGAVDTLRGLREHGVRTAVISNADGRARHGLRSAGLAEHLELVVDSHEEGVEKPDPEIFRRTLDRLELAARRVVYIGDIYSIDATGARAAGIAPVIIDVAGVYRDLDCPVIGDLRELLGWLEGVPAAGKHGKRANQRGEGER